MSKIISGPSYSGVAFGGPFVLFHYRGDRLIGVDDGHNLVPDEGVMYCLNAAMGNVIVPSAFYIGLFKGNYNPVTSDTGSTFAASATEATEYAESTRPAWTTGNAASNSLTNMGAEAEVTISTAVTLYGAFVISDNTKGGNVGTLLAARRYSSSRDAKPDDVLMLRYSMDGSSS